MPMKAIPPGYVAATRRDKKAVTVYLPPEKHAALRQLAHYEAKSVSNLFMDAFEKTYGVKMARLMELRSAAKVDSIP